MQITHSSIDTQKGPADWFTGDVYIDAVAAPAGTSTFASALVHFTPGARTAWHTHPSPRPSRSLAGTYSRRPYNRDAAAGLSNCLRGGLHLVERQR